MKILVTGATGFIGKHLLENFTRNSRGQIWCVSRTPAASLPSGVTPVIASLAEKGWARKLPTGIDLVVHLAQSTRYREFPAAVEDIFRVNVEATLELAEWARRAGARRFLLASTGNVYGHSATESSETDAIDPRTMYAASKASAEYLLRPYAEYFEVLAMRLFGVYGPGQKNTLFPRLISKLATGGEITVGQDVGVRLNPVFVDDCVEVIWRLGSVPLPTRHEIVNVGGREIIDLPCVIRVLEALTGQRAVVRVTDDAPVSLVGSVRKLLSLTGYEGFTPLKEGLCRTIRRTESIGEHTP